MTKNVIITTADLRATCYGMTCVSRVLLCDLMQARNYTHVKGAAETCNSPEKECHGKIASQNDHVENEEGSSFTDQAARKVDYNAKYEDLGRCKGNIDEDLGKPKRGRPVEGVGAMFVDYGAAK